MRSRYLAPIQRHSLMLQGRFALAMGIIAMLLATQGCELINPAEDIPSYIHIDSVMLETESSEGTASHKISDVWVFVNDNSIGVFELPATIPILESGNNNIKLRPGIKNNGIAASRRWYPFFERVSFDLDLVPGQVDTLEPVTHYVENLNIYNEDFNSLGVNFVTHSESDTTLLLTQDPFEVFEGTGSGVVHLDATNQEWRIDTDEDFVLPKLLTPVYLELNYKTNNHFVVGILATSLDTEVQQLKIILNPTWNDDETQLEWNKTYIDLTNEVSMFPEAISYEIYIEMVQDQDFDGNILVQDPVLYLDNFKLVYPQ